MEHQPYPSVRYHASGKVTRVWSDEESEALAKDPEWSDAPHAGVKHDEPKHSASPQPTETGEYAKNARVKALQPRKPANPKE